LIIDQRRIRTRTIVSTYRHSH